MRNTKIRHSTSRRIVAYTPLSCLSLSTLLSVSLHPQGYIQAIKLDNSTVSLSFENK